MSTEWSCCFCDKKESFVAPKDGFDNLNFDSGSESEEEEEGYLLCTCCEQPSTWFHANKEICLQRLLERFRGSETAEEKQEAEDAAARVQTAHDNVRFEESRKRDGESYFFYNCEDCSARECFGCKKASLTREEPHNIGTLRASLCAGCGEKASCSRKYKGKNYTRGVDSDVYLCSSACEKRFWKKREGDSPADKTVKLTETLKKRITNAISTFEEESTEQFKQRRQSLSKWLNYFEKREGGGGDSGGEEIVPSPSAKQDLTKLIPSDVHFDRLTNSKKGRSFNDSKTDQEKSTRGKLFVDHIISVVTATGESERSRMQKMKESETDLTEEQRTTLGMTYKLVDYMDNVCDGLRTGRISLEDILVLIENEDAVGIGGNDMLEYYKSKYLAAKALEASKDQYKSELNSQIASFKAQRDNLKAATAAIRDSLYRKLLDKILNGADTVGEDDDDDDDDNTTLVAEEFSFSVLNKPAWPIVHQDSEGEDNVCVKVNFWQWAWYHEHRTLKDKTTEAGFLEMVQTAVNDVVSDEEDVQGKTFEDRDEADATEVKNVAEFKAYFDTLKKTWQQKHFTLHGRNKSKVLTLDAVPLEWQSSAADSGSPADSDVDMKDADETEKAGEEDAHSDSDVDMKDVRDAGGDKDQEAEEEEEEAPILQQHSEELIVATAKHFKICVHALNKRYNTSVVPPDFGWNKEFPESIQFDTFAIDNASERAKDVIEELVRKALPKLKECSNAYRAAYTLQCSKKKNTEEALYEGEQDALDTLVKQTVEKFNRVQKFLNDKNVKRSGKACFEIVMQHKELFIIAKEYFASEAVKKEKVETFMDKCLFIYEKGKKEQKVKHAWDVCNTQFEIKKKKYGITDESFANFLKMALKSKLKQLSEERADLLGEKEENTAKFMKFLADFVENKAIAAAKQEGESAKEELRDFLRRELDELYAKYTMYYDGVSTNDDIDLWFPMLSHATKAKRERMSMEAKEDIADAKLFEYDLLSEEKVRAWQDSIEEEADNEKNREFAEEEKRCFKYFKQNLGLDQAFKSENVLKKEKALKKEKDEILKAYKRHTMFHHLGHASFVDCGSWAQKQGYDMNRSVFAEWEERSLKKYMKYYEKNFNPKRVKRAKNDWKVKNELTELYKPKDAEEGRSVALAQIREAAVMRWRQQIYLFKDAWKAYDDDKMTECREVLKETFCTTGWMETVRSNERTVQGLKDAYADRWTYKDEKTPSNGRKQPSIFETGSKKEGNLNSEGLWERYAKDDAIFGVKPDDAAIRGDPKAHLTESVNDNDALDVMSATYCPQCGLATLSEFNVYDKPYPDDFPDRNMYPNARLDDKNLQFCGVGDEYETNTKLTDRAKFHFAVNVGLRESYVKHLAKFTTRQFVTLGSTQCETLPNGGCLEAFTRKQAVEGLDAQKKTQASKISLTSWKTSFINWENGLKQLTTPELKEKHANIFRVDVRLPLWQGKKVRAPPGYRLVQYPNKGWTWQLEPFFDPLQTPLLKVEEEGKMQWHSQKLNPAFKDQLQTLSALCQSVGVNMKILHNIETFQCEDQGWPRRQGKRQFVVGDKPYAWLLPVAPAVNAEEDNKLNGVQSDNAKIARMQLKFTSGKVTNNEWQPNEDETLTWYIEDVVGVEDVLLLRRLELRRNTFLEQQRQVMKRCQTELSRYLIRRKNKNLTSLYKSKTSASVSEKMDAYSNLSFSHKAYKFNERPNRTSAAAPPEEVKAWMTSVLTEQPLRMYECKRSGKPCIYVESRKNNVTADSIAACAHASPPENTMHFVTTQQYDIEADKFVQSNLKKFLQKKVKIFYNVLNELGREISRDGFKRGGDDESDSMSDSGLDSEFDFGSDNDEESKPEEDDENKPEGVTEEMKNDGWEYSATWERYYRNAQDERGEMYTSQKPILWDDGKYYAWEEIDQKERGEPAGGGAEDRSGDGGNSGDESSSDEEEMSDLDLGGNKNDGSKADGGDESDSDESDSDGSDSDGSDSDGSNSAAAAEAAADAAADAADKAAEAAKAAEAEAGFSESALVQTAAFEAVAAAHRAAEAAKAAEATATVKTIKEAKAATKAAKAAAKAAKDATEKAYAERFSRYIADAAQRARPSEPREYDKQEGVQCGRHATNNFLELEESDRRKMIARFQEREPTGVITGYASGTIASMFQISKRDDFAVSIAENSKPFTEDEWNAIRDNEYFMGFIARPPEEGLRNKAHKRKARQLNKLKSQRTALHEILNPMELRQAALDKTILLMCRQYIEGKPIPDEVKKNIRHESTLGRKLIQDIKRYVQNADILQAVNTYVENQAVLQDMNKRDKDLLRKILALQTGWHWVAVRKYASGEFYVINSQGPTVEQWDPTVENANKFSITKIMVFSSVEEAQKLQAKNKSKIDAIEEQSRKREFREITQFARDILKDTFGRSDEESDDLLGSGDEDSDSDGEPEGELGKRLRQATSEAADSLGGAAAARPSKKPKTGALFRMLREMYI